MFTGSQIAWVHSLPGKTAKSPQQQFGPHTFAHNCPGSDSLNDWSTSLPVDQIWCRPGVTQSPAQEREK